MIQHVMDIIRWRSWRKKWKNRNKHNFCEIQSKFNMDNVHIGQKTYGMINAHIYNNEKEQLYIGSFCSIAENVHFVFSEHDYTRFCSYPFDEFILKKYEQNPTKGKIVIEDDVWIGMNCLILSGVTIHRGAVIGAGTVVTQDIPAYAIYAGGRIIKYRFSEEIIDKLMRIDYGLLTDDVIRKYRDELYKSVDDKFFETDFYQSIIKNKESKQ